MKEYKFDKNGAAIAADGMCFVDKRAKYDVSLHSVADPDNYYYVTITEAEQYLLKPKNKRLSPEIWYKKLYQEKSVMKQTKTIIKEDSPKFKSKNKNEIASQNLTTHSERFELNLKKIEEYSKNIPSNYQLPVISESGGLFGWFDHTVTGEEINKLSKSVQNQLLASNRVLKDTISEFSTVYDTIKVLDEDYIQGILISLKAAEEANCKALKGLDGVKKNTDAIQKDQGDISHLVEQHTELIDRNDKIIQALKSFQKKIDNLEHVTDVDEMFGKLETLEKVVSEVKNSRQELISEMRTFEKNLNQEIENLNSQHAVDMNNQTGVIQKQRDYIEEKNQELTNRINHKVEAAIAVESVKNDREQKDLLSQIGTLKDSTNNELILTKETYEQLSQKLKSTQIFSGVAFVIVFILLVMIIAGVFL